jgi:Nuclease-related domain
MHNVDRKWIDLSAGYKAIQAFKTSLTAEFGRAVRIGHRLQFRKDLTEWQKKRRVFFTLVAAAPLSIIALCLTAFYFRDVACVIIYWTMLVFIILVTLAVAGRQYVREMVNGKPVPQHAESLVVDLEGRWWDSLSAQDLVDVKAGDKGSVDFQTLLSRSLSDNYFVQNHTNTDMLLLGPSGIWIFRVVNWSGTMVKQEGIWTQIETVRDSLGQKNCEEKTHEPGPDDQWLQLKQDFVKKIENHLPEQVWVLDLIQGGVVFAHPKVDLDKKRIQGNAASYGRSNSWVERVRRAPPANGFTLEIQMEILDVLTESNEGQTVSAKDESERLYRQAVEELQAYVAKMVK